MNSITLFYNGEAVVHQPVISNRIRIGAAADNDLVLAASSVRERQLIIDRDPRGCWRSVVVGGDGDDGDGGVLFPGRRISLGDYEVEWKGTTGIAVDRLAEATGILGDTQVMRRLREHLTTLAPLSGPVLIEGESGTGKELAAAALHSLSPRANGPLVAVNCGALSPTLANDVFFGHEKGAFTGASDAHRGVFERADGGTLFLDELGELSSAHQSSLLRLLDNGVVCRLGSERVRRVNFRLVAATNRRLETMVEEGTFRLDLFHRIATFSVRTPALRHRKEDIPLMARFFLDQVQKETGPRILTDSAIAKMRDHSWPGNCRELRNVLYKAAVLCGRRELRDCDLELTVSTAPQRPAVSDEEVVSAIINAGGNVAATARQLGMARSTLRARLKTMPRSVMGGAPAEV